MDDKKTTGTHGLDLNNYEFPLHVVRPTLKELEDVINEYEIKHTVKFIIANAFEKPFNKSSIPWRENRVFRLRYISTVVPSSYGPFVNVGKRQYDCKFGKQRKPPKEDKVKSKVVTTTKIGCVSQVMIEEIIVFPQCTVSHNITRQQRNNFSQFLNNHFRMERNGEASNLKWERQFHMLIGPLNEHKHDIGEFLQYDKQSNVKDGIPLHRILSRSINSAADDRHCQPAGPHMKVDPLVKKRMSELAESGIFSTDIVRDNISHFVEEVLFKDKTPPLKSNRRFYPHDRDIQNVVGKIKKTKTIKPPDKLFLADVSSEEQRAISQISDGFNMPAASQGISQYQQVHTYTEATSQITPQYQEQVVNEYPDLLHLGCGNEQPQHLIPQTETEVCIQTTPQLDSNNHKQSQANRSSTISEYTTRPLRWNQKDAKTKFHTLMRQLNRIANTIEKEEDFKKLSASIVNVIFEARPMIPESKRDEIFQEEARVLLHPRRIRDYKKRPPKRVRPRAPSIKEADSSSDLAFAKLRKVTGKHWTDVYGTPVTPEVKTPVKHKIAKQTLDHINYVSLVQPTPVLTSSQSVEPTSVPVSNVKFSGNVLTNQATSPSKVQLARAVTVNQDVYNKLITAKNIQVIKKPTKDATETSSGQTTPNTITESSTNTIVVTNPSSVKTNTVASSTSLAKTVSSADSFSKVTVIGKPAGKSQPQLAPKVNYVVVVGHKDGKKTLTLTPAIKTQVSS